MSTSSPDEQSRQRDRRKRVARMKSVIILTVALWMIGSLVAIGILALQVVRLNKRIDNLVTVESGADRQEDTELDVAKKQPQTVEDTTAGEAYVDADNLAQEGDTHKVYLTFDSGPDEETGAILDALAAAGVKATFFVAGNEDPAMQDVYKRIVTDGHTLGMHSYSDQYSTIYASKEAFTSDLQKIRELLKNLTGAESVYYRFPGGSSNRISNTDMRDFIRVLNESKIRYFDWNVSAGDSSADATPESIVDQVTAGVSKYKTSIVLLHDGAGQNQTAEAIGPLVDALRSMNAEILPIDDNTKVIQYIPADDIE